MSEAVLSSGARSRWIAPFALVIGALTLAGVARAQTPPADPNAIDPNAAADAAPTTEGDASRPEGTPAPVPAGVAGVPVVGGVGFALSADGRSRLHLGIDAATGLDTNPYSVPSDEAAFAGDLALRLRPHADVDYPGSLLAFQGEGMVDYGYLPGLLDARTRPVVNAANPSALDYFLLYQSLLKGDLEVNRGGAFDFALGDSVSWNSDPGNVSLGIIFNRLNNELRAGFGVRPGGGALTFKLSNVFGYTHYFDVQSLGGCLAEGCLDTLNDTVSLRADYKFLPRTGFFAAINGGITTYPVDVQGTNPNAFPVGILVGVQGQLLAKVSGLASVGYQNPLVVDDAGQITTLADPDVVGQIELQWQPSPLTRIGGGFQRTFAPTPLYEYIGNNRFFASVNQMLGGRFLLNVNVGYALLQFGDEQVALTDRSVAGADRRFDGQVDANAGLSYFFTDWMSLGVVNRFDFRHTNANDIETGANFGFLRNQTYVLASIAY